MPSCGAAVPFRHNYIYCFGAQIGGSSNLLYQLIPHFGGVDLEKKHVTFLTRSLILKK